MMMMRWWRRMARRRNEGDLDAPCLVCRCGGERGEGKRSRVEMELEMESIREIDGDRETAHVRTGVDVWSADTEKRPRRDARPETRAYVYVFRRDSRMHELNLSKHALRAPLLFLSCLSSTSAARVCRASRLLARRRAPFEAPGFFTQDEALRL